jgi:hypothetical protein
MKSISGRFWFFAGDGDSFDVPRWGECAVGEDLGEGRRCQDCVAVVVEHCIPTEHFQITVWSFVGSFVSVTVVQMLSDVICYGAI